MITNIWLGEGDETCDYTKLDSFSMITINFVAAAVLVVVAVVVVVLGASFLPYKLYDYQRYHTDSVSTSGETL